MKLRQSVEIRVWNAYSWNNRLKGRSQKFSETDILFCYNFFENINVFTIATAVQISIGAKAKIAFSSSLSRSLMGKIKYKIPITISNEDQNISCLPPYWFMLYQFSSEVKDFENRNP